MLVLDKNAGFPACYSSADNIRDNFELSEMSGNLHLPRSQIALNAVTRIRLGISATDGRRDSGEDSAVHFGDSCVILPDPVPVPNRIFPHS